MYSVSLTAVAARATRRRPPPLAPRLEEEQRGRDAHVEALHRRLHGDGGERVAGARHERPQAAALGAEHQHDAAGEVEVEVRSGGLAGRPVDPEAGLLRLLEEGDHVGHLGDGQVLDGAGRGLDGGRRHGGRAVPRHDEAAGAGGQRAARHGAEVARVADLVEHDDDLGAAAAASADA